MDFHVKQHGGDTNYFYVNTPIFEYGLIFDTDNNDLFTVYRENTIIYKTFSKDEAINAIKIDIKNISSDYKSVKELDPYLEKHDNPYSLIYFDNLSIFLDVFAYSSENSNYYGYLINKSCTAQCDFYEIRKSENFYCTIEETIEAIKSMMQYFIQFSETL